MPTSRVHEFSTKQRKMEDSQVETTGGATEELEPSRENAKCNEESMAHAECSAPRETGELWNTMSTANLLASYQGEVIRGDLLPGVLNIAGHNLELNSIRIIFCELHYRIAIAVKL